MLKREGTSGIASGLLRHSAVVEQAEYRRAVIAAADRRARGGCGAAAGSGGPVGKGSPRQRRGGSRPLRAVSAGARSEPPEFGSGSAGGAGGLGSLPGGRRPAAASAQGRTARRRS